MKPDLLSFTSKGIYCAAADVYLDPWRPVDKAIISHAHADHSRFGNKKYIAHHHSVPVMKHRLGTINVQGVSWNDPFSVNGVEFTLYPAGHIVGSSLIKVQHKGEIALFTGDYKLENDGLSTPLEMQRCHTLITECTFGLPIFRWKPQQEVFSEIMNWWSFNQQNSLTSVIYAYSLGKAQRLLHHLHSTHGPILVHPAIAAVNESLSNIVSF
ncbi:MAG: DNA ligase-associated DEXH box helicase, partial [Flavobacteriaceae bacterium]